jgi:hypothetical protein
MRSSGRVDAPDSMSTIEGLEAFTGRGAGTDAERRAANWLAARCAAPGREALIETFWCRPNWALAHLWHVALAIAGSLISLASAIAGFIILAIALVSITADAVSGMSLGRRLTPERASQNVVVRAPPESSPAVTPGPRLILTANYDAGRIGFAYRPWMRGAARRLERTLRGLTPGWLGWLALAVVWLLAVAALREAGHKSQVIGAIQFVPTVGLLLAFALLLELATGQWSPAAGDNGSGVAVALELAAALTAATPRHLQVEILLGGAGDGDPLGLRHHLRAQRRQRKAARHVRRETRADTIVLGFAPCAGGSPHWWTSDGSFLPLRYSASLRRMAARIATDEPHLGVGPSRGRGATSALAARVAGLPALAIGCLDGRGLAPSSHQTSDTAAGVDRGALGRAVQFALLLIDELDATVGEARPQPHSAATPA